jgi:hypothetical protein
MRKILDEVDCSYMRKIFFKTIMADKTGEKILKAREC